MIDTGIQERLAANLRRLRIARHLSLSELARATTMSKATLSGIENGRANPTVETLAALAGALRVPVSELLDEPPQADVRIVRAARDEVPSRPLDGDDVVEVALAPRESRQLRAAAEGSRAGVYVLRGPLIAGPVERASELGTGDWMTFPGDAPHVLETGRSAARALLVLRGPA